MENIPLRTGRRLKRAKERAGRVKKNNGRAAGRRHDTQIQVRKYAVMHCRNKINLNEKRKVKSEYTD
jgi:hypothetical protein